MSFGRFRDGREGEEKLRSGNTSDLANQVFHEGTKNSLDSRI